MTGSSEDLRRYPRVSVDVAANVRTTDGRKLVARTRDLSRSGICIITTSALTPGEQLRIELVLLLGPTSSSEPLPLAARVVWCTPIAGAFQIGAKFDRVSTKEATFLDMFLRYLDGSLLPAGAEMEVIEVEDDASGADAHKVRRSPPPDVKDDPFKS
jgi:hypothetical protein